MAVDSGQYTPETIARRVKMAEALLADPKKPITHWAEGLNELAKGALGGYRMGQAERMEREGQEELARSYAERLGLPAPAPSEGSKPPLVRLAMALTGGAGEPEAPSAVSPITAGAVPSQSSTAGKIYEADEPSPLDPPSGKDRDLAIRTMIAEAGNQGPEGLQAVGSVIRNRAVRGNFGGDTPTGVVTAQSQFEPWNTAAGRARMGAIDPNSPQYQAAGAALDRAYFGDDPTSGATHFYAPKAQAALGRPEPAWARGRPGQDIGEHRFYGGANQPVRVAQALTGQSEAAPAVTGAMPPGADAGKQEIARMLQSRNPYVRHQGMALAQKVIEKDLTRDPLDAEAKRLDIETKRRGLEAAPTVQRVKQPDGSEVAVQWDRKRNEWVPLKAPEGGNAVAAPKLTEQQSKDVGFYNRGEKLLPRLEKQDQALTDFLSAGGGAISNYFKSDAYRQAEQTGKELLAVILRKDTGAAVTPSEMEQYASIYLPKPGDDKATIEQKRVARRTAIEGLRLGLGSADIIFRSREAAEAAKAKPPEPAVDVAPQKASGTPAAPKVGDVQQGYRFKGGNPADPKSWEKVQ